MAECIFTKKKKKKLIDDQEKKYKNGQIFPVVLKSHSIFNIYQRDFILFYSIYLVYFVWIVCDFS